PQLTQSSSTHFPYTTRFRSRECCADAIHAVGSRHTNRKKENPMNEYTATAVRVITDGGELVRYTEHDTAEAAWEDFETADGGGGDRKSTRLNSSHVSISYAV